jgi:hypothetical protein
MSSSGSTRRKGASPTGESRLVRMSRCQRASGVGSDAPPLALLHGSESTAGCGPRTSEHGRSTSECRRSTWIGEPELSTQTRPPLAAMPTRPRSMMCSTGSVWPRPRSWECRSAADSTRVCDASAPPSRASRRATPSSVGCQRLGFVAVAAFSYLIWRVCTHAAVEVCRLSTYENTHALAEFRSAVTASPTSLIRDWPVHSRRRREDRHDSRRGMTALASAEATLAARSSDEMAAGVPGLRSIDERDAVAELSVACGDGCPYAGGTQRLQEGLRCGRLVSPCVHLGGDALEGAGAHELEPEVDHALVRGQQVGVDESQAVEQPVDLGVEQVRGDRSPGSTPSLNATRLSAAWMARLERATTAERTLRWRQC